MPTTLTEQKDTLVVLQDSLAVQRDMLASLRAIETRLDEIAQLIKICIEANPSSPLSD